MVEDQDGGQGVSHIFGHFPPMPRVVWCRRSKPPAHTAPNVLVLILHRILGSLGMV